MLRIEIPTPCLFALHAEDPDRAAAYAADHFEPEAIVTLAPSEELHAPPAVRKRVGARLRDRQLIVVCGRLEPTGLRQDLVRLAKLENHYATALLLGELDSQRVADWRKEGFRRVWEATGGEPVELTKTRLRSDLRHLRGPFDVIGDVHGCREELEELLAKLGYALEPGEIGPIARHPDGRTLVFLGDLCDRGPDTPGALRLAMASVREGDALCVPGNHEAKLRRYLKGSQVNHAYGFDATVEQLADASPDFLVRIADFIDDLPSHLMLDGGELCVTHAGLPPRLQGRASRRVRSHCLYGETTGETDAKGYPIRVDWAAKETEGAFVVYGHTPVGEPKPAPRAICIDTACVFGGSLTAFRWPERELVSVPARRTYFEQ
ncbi:MAG: metallophosphoesterase [Planctomycetes bacterium]|nr:metallophosphoesterase [Planctomycetota bacterium]MCB9903259.1 metallophosphoesterase [Planctomycetota bacterium]